MKIAKLINVKIERIIDQDYKEDSYGNVVKRLLLEDNDGNQYYHKLFLDVRPLNHNKYYRFFNPLDEGLRYFLDDREENELNYLLKKRNFY